MIFYTMVSAELNVYISNAIPTTRGMGSLELNFSFKLLVKCPNGEETTATQLLHTAEQCVRVVFPAALFLMSILWF